MKIVMQPALFIKLLSLKPNRAIGLFRLHRIQLTKRRKSSAPSELSVPRHQLARRAHLIRHTRVSLTVLHFRHRAKRTRLKQPR